MIYQAKQGLTVNFDNTMTAAQIQYKIDQLPKNLNNFWLVFQFADGTYTLNASLNFNNFANGYVGIQGNPAENQYALHSNQAVHLNFSSGGLVVSGCSNFAVINLKITVPANTDGVQARQGNGTLNGNYFVNPAITGNAGLYLRDGVYNVNANYITKFKYGIFNTTGLVSSWSNAELTNSPDNGLYTEYGKIGKNSTQPAGATTNELLNHGGVISQSTIQAITAADPPTQAEMVAALGAASLYPSRNILISSTGGTPYLVSSDGTSWYYSAYTVGA